MSAFTFFNWIFVAAAPKNLSRETRYVVQNLNPCSSYMFDVAVQVEGSYGPLSDSPKSAITNIDPKAAPRDVKVSLDDPVLIKIKWRSSCDFTSIPIAYRVIYISHILQRIPIELYCRLVIQRRCLKLFSLFQNSLDYHHRISLSIRTSCTKKHL